MAIENDMIKEQLNGEANEGLTTFKFRFKINAREFAARFGVDVPDDSADSGIVSETSDTGVCCGADAEDAAITYPAHVKATLDQCKAKNPMLCPYHGMKAVSSEIENILRSAGVNGNVECTVYDAQNGVLEVGANVTAPASDETKVQAAMASFFKLPGVTKVDDMSVAGRNEIEGIFDLDMLDPNAQARWGFGQQAPQTAMSIPSQAPATAHGPAQPQTAPQTSAQAKATVQTAQPSQTTPPKRTRTRKQTGKALAAAPAANLQPEPQHSAAETTTSSNSGSTGELPSEDAPTLYPGVAPKEPPKWTPPYDANELAELSAYSERIGKTAERIDEQINKGNMANYLATKKGDPNKPNANLPKGLQKYKNHVDCSKLKMLAAKDTDGQVKKMLEVADKINASEANGWMDKIGMTHADVAFDPSKYDDPYAKERAAFKNYKPVAIGREDDIKSLSMVESSNSKDAPKKALQESRNANQIMTEIEDAFKQADELGLKNDAKKALAQAYYSANKAFDDSIKACKEWLSKQSVMQSTVEDTARVFSERNGRDALYLTKLSDNLKNNEKIAKSVCENNFPEFKKDPDGCTKRFQKNLKHLFEHASMRISMSMACVETLLADPKSSTVHKGYPNGKYTPTSIDYDYQQLAQSHFGVWPTTKRDIHKYGALFLDTGKHSNDHRSKRYGEVEVAFDIKTCLAFLGGCHSQTRGMSVSGWNASLVTDPRITIVPYLLNRGSSVAKIKKLFTKDMTKKESDIKEMYDAISSPGHSWSYGAAVPEIWFADDITRDMVKGIYTQSPAAQSKIARFCGDFIRDNNIELA